MSGAPKIDYVTECCGGEHYVDAFAVWDVEAQAYVLAEVFEKGDVCGTCGGERPAVKAVEVQE